MYVGIKIPVVLAFLFIYISVFVECRPMEGYVPVVLWHGMGDHSDGSVKKIITALGDELPGIYVKSLRIGESAIGDTLNSFFLNANEQVEQACEMVRSDPKLQDGFNMIGFSQGGQFLRALVQRCPEARVKTLIVFGSQQQGVYGVPKCSPDISICDAVRKGVTWVVYQRFVQHHLVQGQYWKDPVNPDSYLKYNTFLADINNEGPVKNQTYVKNLAKLEKFVMVRFNLDTTVIPVATSWFGFYTPGQSKEVQSMNETTLYKEDWLGLQSLDKKGALDFLELDADHLRISIAWFKDVIIKNYLK